MGGLEALKLLRGIDPGVRAIVCSGYAQDPVMSAYREHGFFGILRKPFTLEQVSDIIREVASG
jgi:DNA-binding NtrC family response regulator